MLLQRILRRLTAGVAVLCAMGGMQVAFAQTVAWQAFGPGGRGDIDAQPGCGVRASSKRSMATDTAGNVVVTGCTDTGANQDYLTVKYAPSGGQIWSRRWNGPANGNDAAYAVAVDSAGNVLVTGRSSNGSSDDYTTIKYSAATGEQLWVSRYSGAANGDEAAVAVAVDGAGNVMVTGYSSNGTNNDYATVKYAAATGAQLWVSRYSESASSDEEAIAVAVDGAGNVLVTGSSYNGTYDYATIKYAAATGAQLWANRYNGPANGTDAAYAVAVDSAGNVLVTGQSSNGSNNDYATVKYAAANGAQLWASRYNGPADDYAFAVAVDSADNVLVTGYSSNGSNDDYATVKYAAATGAQLWTSRYNGPANTFDYAYAVAVDNAGDVLVTGYSNNGSNNDYATVKYAAATGAQVWASRYNGPANGFDYAYAVAVDNAGNVLVAGYSHNGRNNDFLVVKYAAATGTSVWTANEPDAFGLADRLACGDAVAAKGALADWRGDSIVVGCVRNWSYDDYQVLRLAPDDGSVRWSASYNGPANNHDAASAVAVDSAGNVLVTGRSSNGNNYDYATVKYSPSGVQLWASRYNGPANSHDFAYAVAVDNAGDVLVTGFSEGSSYDYATVKYAAATGAQIWASRYNGPADNSDYAYALAVDSTGNVLVTGFSNNDYATIKYAAATGAQVWASAYNGPANSQDFANAVAVDNAGNVLVTGNSSNGSTNDYATIKYAAATGAQVWASRYNGPANSSEYAYAAALDSAGNVLVTGYSHNGSNNDYATVKYAAATGTELWASRYNGPANGTDEAYSVAVDSANDVLVTGQSFESGGIFSTAATQKLSGIDGSQRWLIRADFGVEGAHRGGAVRVAADRSIRVAAMAFPGGERIGVLRINDQEASATAITSDAPDPSVVGQAVTIDVTVTGVSTQPTDGQVLVTASTGETCTDTTASVGSGTTALFSCSITFSSPGARNLGAAFSATSSHAASTSAAEAHNVVALPTLSINDVVAVEGDVGTSTFQFTISRSHALNAVSVQVDTANGSAAAGSDYTAIIGQTINLPAGGAATATVDITVNRDLVLEANETFIVNLSNATGATLSDGQGTGTINNDDTASIAITGVALDEGNSGTTAFVFTAMLSGAVQDGFSVPVASANGSAATPVDYAAIVAGTTLSFVGTAGETQTISVAVVGETLFEHDETFGVSLGAPSNAAVTVSTSNTTGTIRNDDAAPAISISNPSQNEGNSGNSPMDFVVSLSAAAGRDISFNRATANGSATLADNDYLTLTAATATIPAGSTSLTIPVQMVGDVVNEGDESFSLVLGAVDGATPAALSGTGTLVDDDQQPTTTMVSGQTPMTTVTGQSYSVLVTVTAVRESPLGMVTISEGSASCGPVALVPGTSPASTATCTLTSLSAGTRTLAANYTPASSAFAPSSATATHAVGPAATTISVSGPARSRVHQPTRFDFDLHVTAPGTGAPTGTVTLTSGAGTCSVLLPSPDAYCNLSFPVLGSREVSASFASSDGNHVGSDSSGNPSTQIYALSDVSVTKSDGESIYLPGDLIVYSVQVRNAGPDAAAQVRVQDVVPAGLTGLTWSCDASGGAVCPAAGGTGNLDHLLTTLPVGALWSYTLHGSVSGAPEQIVNTAFLTLPADSTVEDSALGNNSATDTTLPASLFANGFESPLVNAGKGSIRMPTAALAGVLDEVAHNVVKLDEKRGEVARVYARMHLGAVEYALAVRGADGRWTLGAWSGNALEPVLSWNAELVAGAWQVNRVELR